MAEETLIIKNGYWVIMVLLHCISSHHLFSRQESDRQTEGLNDKQEGINMSKYHKVRVLVYNKSHSKLFLKATSPEQ